MSTPTKQPWQLTEVVAPLSEYRPVLALTTLREHSGELQILAGARTPAANITHPGVVSVPTLRIPQAIATAWPDATDTLDREIENLFARKLGVAAEMELRRLRWKVHALDAWQGTSVIGEDDTGLITEDLTMFNACVEIVEGHELFPRHTASYSPLVWASTADFLTMVETRKVGALNAGLDEVRFCVYGLCLESTKRMLRRMSC